MGPGEPPRLSPNGGAAIYYRLYLLDPFGHILRAHPIEASDDAEAATGARALGYSGAVEVWQLGRKVTTIRPPIRPQLAEAGAGESEAPDKADSA